MFVGAFAEGGRCGRRRGGAERRGAEAQRPKRGIASAERSGAREVRTPGCCEPRSGKHQPRAVIAEAQRSKPVAAARGATTNAATPLRPHAQAKLRSEAGGASECRRAA